MKRINILIALVLSACSLFSCTSFEDMSSQVKEKKIEKMAEEAEDVHETFQRGKVDGSVYTSDFAKIKFTAPDGWVYSPEEELLQAMDIGTEIAGNSDEVTKKLLDKIVIYDAMASAPEGDNVNIAFENVTAMHMTPENFPLEDLLDSVVKDLNIDTTYQGMAMQIVPDGTYYEHTLGGYDCLALDCKGHGETGGMSFDFKQRYYVRYVDDFIMMITVTSFSEDLSDIEACFEKIS